MSASGPGHYYEKERRIASEETPRIVVERNGPYIVRGNVPLVEKSEEMSEFGEPLTWIRGEVLRETGNYALCRCGKSNKKPFCDDTHEEIGFEGTEAADTGQIADRRQTSRSPKIFIKDDHSLCMHSGFCGTRLTNIWEMRSKSNDSEVLAEIIAMIDRCPSGTLTYTLERDGEIIEPDLPKEVGVIPSGPIWTTGGIPVQRSDGPPLETRNRVTLCRCGASPKTPLCDGTHKDIGFSAP